MLHAVATHLRHGNSSELSRRLPPDLVKILFIDIFGALKMDIMSMKDHTNLPDTVAVVGLGQMGGSFALALRFHLPGVRLLGVCPSPDEAAAAVAVGAVDEASHRAEDILPRADLTMLAYPIGPLLDFGKANLHLFKPGSIVTDLSSVKSSVMTALRQPLLERGVHFVGSHPMCGTEKTGLNHASPELFRGAVAFVSPEPGDCPSSTATVSELWRRLGSRIVVVRSEEHDKALAYTSHVLHLIANMSTHIALEGPFGELARQACAGSFRDVSRIASANPGMWRNIVAHNSPAVLGALDHTLDELTMIRQLIAEGRLSELEAYLGQGKRLRDAWFSEYTLARQESQA